MFLADIFSDPPPDIFHDPNTLTLIRIGVALVAIIVAIGVGIYQVRQSRTQRKLEYAILSDTPIVSVNTLVAKEVEIDIKVKGILAKDAHLVILSIKNTGKASIHTADYFEPMTFEFDKKVLSASILDTTPKTLIKPDEIPTFLTLASQSIGFPLFQLNPKDIIQMSIILEGPAKMHVRGRLDQGYIVEYDSEKARRIDNVTPSLAVVTLIMGLAVIAPLLLIVLLTVFKGPVQPTVVLTLLTEAGATVVGIIGLMLAKKRR